MGKNPGKIRQTPSSQREFELGRLSYTAKNSYCCPGGSFVNHMFPLHVCLHSITAENALDRLVRRIKLYLSKLK